MPIGMTMPVSGSDVPNRLFAVEMKKFRYLHTPSMAMLKITHSVSQILRCGLRMSRPKTKLTKMDTSSNTISRGSP